MIGSNAVLTDKYGITPLLNSRVRQWAHLLATSRHTGLTVLTPYLPEVVRVVKNKREHFSVPLQGKKKESRFLSLIVFCLGNSLITLTFHLLNQYGLVELFQLDMVKLWRFLVMVQEDYHSNNPYHNAVHAADVTQAMYCFLQEPKVGHSNTS